MFTCRNKDFEYSIMSRTVHKTFEFTFHFHTPKLSNCLLYLWGVTFWLDGFRCIYGVRRSDWMVFAVFMGCDVLIEWFLLYLWGVTFWLDGFCCIYGVWHSDWMVFAVFMGCDVLIGWFSLYFLLLWRSDWMVFVVFMGCDVLVGWFSLYLWGVTFWLDGFRFIHGLWRSDWMVFPVFMGCDVLIG